MSRLFIRRLAQQDIQDIVDYYEAQAPHVVDRFLNQLYSEFDTIQEHPELFQKKYRETRVRYLKGFPSGIHYIFHNKEVEVLAVYHTRRNPDIWTNL